MQSHSITVQPSNIQIVFEKTNSTTFTIQNISLQQTVIKLFVDHPEYYTLSQNQIMLDTFDQKSITITIKYSSSNLIQNYQNNKIHIFYYNFDEDQEIWNPKGNNIQNFKLINRFQLNITSANQDPQDDQDQQIDGIPIVNIIRVVGANPISEPLKKELIGFVQKFGNLKNVECLQNGNYLATFINIDGKLPTIKQFVYHDKVAIYIISQTIVKQPKKKEIKNQNQIIQNVQKQKLNEQKKKQKSEQKNKLKETEADVIQFKPTKKKNLQNFQSFAGDNSNDAKKSFALNNKKKKRNRSVQTKKKVIEQDSEESNEDDQNETDQNSKKEFNQIIKKRLTEIEAQRIKRQLFREKQRQKEIEAERKHKEKLQLIRRSQIQETQIKPNISNWLVLNCIEQPIGLTFQIQTGYFYIIFETFVQIYNISDKLMVLRKIQIDKITYNRSKKLIIKHYGYKIVLANDAYFYIIDLDTECSEWTYVQRKQIYDFTLIKNLDMLAIGGRNFSKLSLFGKQTNRSNLKIYSFNDHYRHLFTYDIEGAGDICTVEYLKIENKNLLFVYGKNEDQQTIFLIKAISWNEYQILNKFDVNELGIKEIKYFRFSHSSIYALQNMLLNTTKIMVLKKINIRMQQQRPNIFTQSIPINPQVYNYFQNDKQTLVLYSIAKGQLTIMDSINRATHRFRLEKGFRQIKVRMPYIFLLQESQLYIQLLS